MGLDLLELVIATETAFGIAIPDPVVVTLDTPRKVIDYLERRLVATEEADCLTQHAFYRVRAALMRRFDLPRARLTPTTRIRDVLPASGSEQRWKQVGAELGADRWPKWQDSSWIRRQLGIGPATLGDVAEYLATFYPAAIKREPGWTRDQIEKTFLRLIGEETAVDMSKHTVDSRFGRDMGVD